MRSLSLANWVLNPFQSMGTEQIYDLIGRDSPATGALWLNLGYWKQADDLTTACEALATLVAETAAMSHDDDVVDCGFGFGDQDIWWALNYAPRSIVGLNITQSHVMHARQRVEESGVDDTVDLRVGSATAMPLEAASASVVVALESAFHFDTREAFFDEAYRVLRPGGRLVIADILPRYEPGSCLRTAKQRLSWRLTANKFAIPAANAYPVEHYTTLLKDRGYEQVAVESIRDDVYRPLHAFLRRNPQTMTRLHPVLRLPARLAMLLDPDDVFAGLDYVIAQAVKPQATTPPAAPN